MEYVELVLVPVLIGILEAIKRAGFNSKFIPLLSIILGIGMGIAFTGFELKAGIMTGLFIGLSAVGLYSGVKNVSIGIKEKS